MFDWPEENHTSPTSTPLSVILLPRLFFTSRLRSVRETFSGFNLTIQSPVLSATAVLV